jgi:cation-transporting ATPase 13A1
MAVDFLGCWIIELLCKLLFADLEPKAMVTKGRERREKRRLLEEIEKAKHVVEANGDGKDKVE